MAGLLALLLFAILAGGSMMGGGAIGLLFMLLFWGVLIAFAAVIPITGRR